MKISYGITVHNEAEELKKLLYVLYDNIDEEDEVVVCVDGDDDAVRFELDIMSKSFFDKNMTMKNLIEKMYNYCKTSLDLFGDKDVIDTINYILDKGTEGDEQIKVYNEGGFDKLKIYLMNNVDYLEKE